ncbi:Spc98 family-domain-containing protein [Syncephalis plumigaleata]|nr:Spc98 family-domain-containing protein [Syncephalis plumigaleata]
MNSSNHDKDVESSYTHDLGVFHAGYPMHVTLPRFSLLKRGPNSDDDVVTEEHHAYISTKQEPHLIIPPLPLRPTNVLLPLNSVDDLYDKVTRVHDRQQSYLSVGRACTTTNPTFFTSLQPCIIPVTSDIPIDQKQSLLESTAVKEEEEQQIESNMLWDNVINQPYLLHKNKLLSWDKHDSIDPATSIYLTELGTSGFEAIYSWQFESTYSPDTSGRLVEFDTLVQGIFCLLQGRKSRLFVWNEEQLEFQLTMNNLRIVGYGSASLAGIIEQIRKFGTILCRLEHVANICRNKPELYGMTGVAFGTALDDYLSFVKQALVSHIEKGLEWKDTTRTSKQSVSVRLSFIQHAIEPTYNILWRLYRLCGYSSDTDTQFKLPRGSALLSHIYTALLNEDFTRTPVYFELLLVLMDVACRPLFQWLGCWLGVQSDDNVDAFRWIGDPWQPRDPYNEFFIVYANGNEEQSSRLSKQATGISMSSSQPLALHLSAGDTFWQRGYQLSSQVEPPSFLAQSLVNGMLATGKCLRLLRDCQSDHPVFNILEASDLHTDNRWSFLPNATSYQSTSMEKQKKDRQTRLNHSISSCITADDFEAFLDGSSSLVRDAFNSLNRSSATISVMDRINYWMNRASINSSDDNRHQLESMPLSMLVDTTVNQKLQRRCRAIDLSVLRYFFNELKFNSHLETLHRCVLFHDGFYMQTLSSALFDNANKSGIRLGIRSLWPPKVSELSTVLHAVLLTSVIGKSGTFEKIDDWLSFGIKEYDNDADICCDANDIAAMDFLYIAYNPPAPLNILLTATSMEKYNRLFCHLLRLNRMSVVMTDIYRLSHNRALTTPESESLLTPLRFKMLHFVEALRAYTFECAVAEPWLRLTRTLERVASLLDTSSSPTTLFDVQMGDHEQQHQQQEEMDHALMGITNLAELHEFHEHTLDRMLDRCLLRQEHAILHKIIEAIFGLILRLDRMMRSGRAISSDTARKLGERLSAFIKKLLQGLVSLERERGRVRTTQYTRATLHATHWRATLYRQEEREGLAYLNSLVTRIDLNGYYSTTDDTRIS